MVHSITNSNTFLAYFNNIDKFFEVVIGVKTYMPFTEKVERISHGQYPVTNFVKKYQHKLKYFGDLRNQVVHGFRLEQHHYLLASDYAVTQIKTVHEHLTKPPTVEALCKRDIPSVSSNTTMQEAINVLIEKNLPALPVCDDQGVYARTLFMRQIVEASLDETFLGKSVAEFLAPGGGQAMFVAADASVYEIEGLFSTQRESDTHVEVVRVTQDGQMDNDILGVITAVDLPKLDQEVIL